MNKPSYLQPTKNWIEKEKSGMEGFHDLKKSLAGHIKVDLEKISPDFVNSFVSIWGNIFYDMSFAERKNFVDIVVLVMGLAEEARSKNAQKIYEARDLIQDDYQSSYEQMMTPLDNVLRTGQTITNKLKNLVECYKEFYELGYKTLITFPIICIDIIEERKKINIAGKLLLAPTQETKVPRLDSFALNGKPASILKYGYCTYIRNAASHGGGTYVPDPNIDSITLSNEGTPFGSFTSTELEEKIKELWTTFKAIELGIEIFTANNRSEWLSYSPEVPPNPKEVRDWIFEGFNAYMLDIIGTPTINNSRTSIKVKAKFKHGLQPSNSSSSAKKLIIAAFRAARVFKWFDKCLIQVYEGRKINYILHVEDPRSLLEKLNKFSSSEEVFNFIDTNNFITNKS